MNNAVAITGMGIISSLGQGVHSLREAIYNGTSNFTTLACPPLSFPIIGARIADFSYLSSLQHYPDKIKQCEKMARALRLPVQMAIIAALEAWTQAEMNTKPLKDASRLGIVAAAQNSSSTYQYDSYTAFQKDPEYLSPTYALNFMDTNYVGVLSEVLGALGEGFTVGGSSASGNVALLQAYNAIKEKRLDACVVVGTIAELSPIEFQGFRNLGALGGHHFEDTPNQACRPFDKQHEGFIYGQASAVMILESVPSAKKRGAAILGYILGGSLVLDANRLSNPSTTGELRAMRLALQNAGVKAEDIDYINTHGTAAPLGDTTEVEAIEALTAKRVPLNATKSITGHCLWSAGIVEAIATVIQMKEGFIHPTLNLEHPISDKSWFVTKKSEPHTINIALSNGFGFGGFNTTIVFKRS